MKTEYRNRMFFDFITSPVVEPSGHFMVSMVNTIREFPQAFKSAKNIPAVAIKQLRQSLKLCRK